MMDRETLTPPNGPKGLYCPLMRKNADRACQTCTFWQPMERVNLTNGETIVEWKCAFVWQMHLAARAQAQMDGLHAAFNGVRDGLAWVARQSLPPPAKPATLIELKPEPSTNGAS